MWNEMGRCASGGFQFCPFGSVSRGAPHDFSHIDQTLTLSSYLLILFFFIVF